jgi:hypothetical protein
VPPAGRVRGLGARPSGALGGEGGALSPKAPELGAAGSEIGALPEACRGWEWPARRSEPYRKRAGGGNGRLGDLGPTGSVPGVGMAGSEIGALPGVAAARMGRWPTGWPLRLRRCSKSCLEFFEAGS